VLEGRNEPGFPKTQFSTVTVRYTFFILASSCSGLATHSMGYTWIDDLGDPLGDGEGGHKGGQLQ